MSNLRHILHVVRNGLTWVRMPYKPISKFTMKLTEDFLRLFRQTNHRMKSFLFDKLKRKLILKRNSPNAFKFKTSNIQFLHAYGIIRIHSLVI